MVNCETNTRTMNVLTNNYITNTITRVFNSLTQHMILSMEIDTRIARIINNSFHPIHAFMFKINHLAILFF